MPLNCGRRPASRVPPTNLKKDETMIVRYLRHNKFNLAMSVLALFSLAVICYARWTDADALQIDDASRSPRSPLTDAKNLAGGVGFLGRPCPVVSWNRTSPPVEQERRLTEEPGGSHPDAGAPVEDTLTADTGPAEGMLEDTLRYHFSDAEAVLVELAESYHDKGRSDDFESLLEEAASDLPVPTDAYVSLAQFYSGNNELGRASSLLESALQASPGDMDLRCAYGDYLELQGRYLEAVEQYQLASEMKASDPMPYYRIGQLYRKMGDGRSACQAFVAASELSAEFAQLVRESDSAGTY